MLIPDSTVSQLPANKLELLVCSRYFIIYTFKFYINCVITDQFEIPSLQPINVGVVSTVHTVTITSPLDSAVYLTPSTGLCASSVSPNTPSYVTFFPPYLLFTPNSTTQSFTYIGNCASNNLGTNFNPVITDASPRRYAGSPVPISVSWQVTEAGASPYTLSFPLNEGGVLAVTVMQSKYNISSFS